MKKTLTFLSILCIFVAYCYALKANEIIAHSDGNTLNFNDQLVITSDTTDRKQEYAKHIEAYKKGKREPQFLYHLAETATKMGDSSNAEKIGSDYIRRLKRPYSKSDITFMEVYTQHSTDPAFSYFYKHPEEVDAALGENSAIDKVKTIIYLEEIMPRLSSNTDWDAIEKVVVSKYDTIGEEILLRAKTLDYFNKGEMKAFTASAVPYINKYGQRVALFEINNYAWAVFQKVDDPEMLNNALAWSKRTLQEKETITFIDTYANLLYKLGRKDEAIAMEEKAVNLAPSNEKVEFQSNLQKMMKGEPTWK